MAVPTIMGQLIVLIYNMADTFFIGRTNNPAMVAGASLILPIFNISLSIAGLAGVGGGSQISRLLGERRHEEAERVSSFSIWFSLMIGGLFSLLVLIFMEPLLIFLGAGSQTEGYAASYAFCVIVLGGIPTVMTNVLSNLIRSVGESGRAGFGVMMGGIINMILDPIFMFLLFPRGMEIVGAGTATCLSNCISCAYFLITILRMGKDSVIRLGFPARLPHRSSIRMIFTVGIPSSVATLLFDLDYVVIDRLMSSYSDTALAAIGIVLKAERLPLNVGIGICQGMVPIVAYNYASGNHKRMHETIRFSRTSGIVFALASICMYEILAPYIMRFFIDDTATVALGTGFLRIRSLATVLMFLSFFHVHLFNSFGRGREALFLGVVRWAVFNIPMLFLLNRIFGMYGIVWSQFTADILTVSLSFYVFSRFVRTHFQGDKDF
ncbi:MAG: MATE family efflux transporter [Lachnospiraceae bacterium]|nr:MATE family efflux transporter [Lachnospiraceae bacterium]